MTSIARRLCALALALAAWPALAQAQDNPHVPPPPPEEARAEGEAILAAAGAGDLFDNLTLADDAAVKLKHRASGLVCAFNPGQPENRVVLFDDGARGDQIACVTGGPAGQRTLYASRAPGRTLDDAFAHDLAEVTRNHPDAQAYSLSDEAARSTVLGLLTSPLLPRSRTARFIAEHNFTSVSSAVYGDWSLEMRYTCPEEMQDLAAGTLQPTLWITTLAQISKAPLDLASPKEAA